MQKELKQREEKFDEWKCRIEQLEKENEQLKREEIVHVEPSIATDIQTLTVNNEEREQFETEIERLKHLYEDKAREMNEWKENEMKVNEDIHQRFVFYEISSSRPMLKNDIYSLIFSLKIFVSNYHQIIKYIFDSFSQLFSFIVFKDFDQWFSIYRQLVETNKVSYSFLVELDNDIELQFESISHLFHVMMKRFNPSEYIN